MNRACILIQLACKSCRMQGTRIRALACPTSHERRAQPCYYPEEKIVRIQYRRGFWRGYVEAARGAAMHRAFTAWPEEFRAARVVGRGADGGSGGKLGTFQHANNRPIVCFFITTLHSSDWKMKVINKYRENRKERIGEHIVVADMCTLCAACRSAARAAA